jgi:hypothetical protein
MANLQPGPIGVLECTTAVMLLLHAGSASQGEVGKQLYQRAAESQESYISQKQDGATITSGRLRDVLKDEYDLEDDYTPPTEYAIGKALSIISGTNFKMKRNFPLGSVSADGMGGIRIQWQWPNQEVRLVIPARPGGREYIYHEQGDTYATEKEVTPKNLANWLNQLD